MPGYEGFTKLSSQLADRPGVRNPKALAASIGRKKYGTRTFNAAASSGRKLGRTSSPASGGSGRSSGR